jgi:hypothetical protein
MQALRRHKLAHLLATRFGGDRALMLQDTGMSKGRLSQLLDPNLPFGDTAARRLEERLQLDPGYFDAMDAQTVEWAVLFDQLPPNLKSKWRDLVALMSPEPPPPVTTPATPPNS